MESPSIYGQSEAAVSGRRGEDQEDKVTIVNKLEIEEVEG
jgi:hypothetical protein